MSSAYVYLPVSEPLRQELLDWSAKSLPDSALDPEGREMNPHITLAYGVSNDKREVARALAPAMAGLAKATTNVTFATYFKHTARSVLVLICASGPLVRYTTALHRTLGSSSSPTLNAHITLAYIRTGRERRTTGLMSFVGRAVTADHLVFVDEAKVHHDIPFLQEPTWPRAY